MTRITGSDQVLLLLQEQLRRMDRGRGVRTERASNSRKATPRAISRLQSLVTLDQLSDEEVRRTLVRALLSEELGEGVANDPSFHTIVEDVFRVINASSDGRELIDRAARQLRAGA